MKSKRQFSSLRGYVKGNDSNSPFNISIFEGEEYIIVPHVIMMMGDVVVHPANLDKPELIPAENFSQSLCISFNNRPCVPGHPQNANGAYISALDPYVLETRKFGFLNNVQIENGNKISAEAWLSKSKAEKVGSDAKDVIERLEKGETIEVSVGCYVTYLESEGEFNGIQYSYVWLDGVGDHLAFLKSNQLGACSVDMGCGALRASNSLINSKSNKLNYSGLKLPSSSSQPVVFTLSEARRPTFKGVETSPWSAPSFADYVKGLYTGDNPPKSLSQASSSLKGAIASRTLLGDPEADNFRDLTLFPVVDPRDDKLNLRALKAILGSRGQAAKISKSLLNSARDMCRKLMETEFNIKTQSSVNGNGNGNIISSYRSDSEMKTKGKNAREFFASLTGKAKEFWDSLTLNTGQEGISDWGLRGLLFEELQKVEPMLGPFYDLTVYPDGEPLAPLQPNTVIFTSYIDDYISWYSRTYNIDNGQVTLNDDKQERFPVMVYKLIDSTIETETESESELIASEDKDDKQQSSNVKLVTNCSCSRDSKPNSLSPQKDFTMSEKKKDRIKALVSNSASPFTEKDVPALELATEDALGALEKLYNTEKAENGGNSNTSIPAPSTVTISEEEYRDIQASAQAYKAEVARQKSALVTSLTSSQTSFTADELNQMDVSQLSKLASALNVSRPSNNSVIDYSARGVVGSVSKDDEEVYMNPPDSWGLKSKSN